MALKLPDSAVPMGDFPVAKAVDIDFDDGENLQEKLDGGKLGGGGGSPEKQIKDWVSGSSYLEGDYIYHEGAIYRCLTSNSDVGFDETNWKRLTYVAVDTGVGHIKRFYSVPENDWNNAIEEGYYTMPADTTADGIANRPYKYATQVRVITADTNDAGYAYQIAYVCARDNRIYIRRQYLGVWTDWEKIATQKDLDNLFQSVSSGKTLVANAITDKGVSTATDATFATMASNISKINTNGYKEETKSYNNTSTSANRLVFTFSADVYGVKQVTPPSDASSHIVPETSTSMFTVNGKELILYVKGAGTWKVTAMVRNA